MVTQAKHEAAGHARAPEVAAQVSRNVAHMVSSLLKALVESSGEFEFGDGREVELKGLTGGHQVFGIELP